METSLANKKDCKGPLNGRTGFESEGGFPSEEDDMADTGSSAWSDHEEEQKEEVVIARKENRTVFYLRTTLIMVIIYMAAAVSSYVYFYSRSSEQEDFESGFSALSVKVVSEFQSSAHRRLGAIAQLAISISSNAAAQGQTWPDVVVPDFERRVTYTLDLASVLVITLFPIVAIEDKVNWEKFSVKNQGWFKEGLAVQGKYDGMDSQELEDIMAKFEKNTGKLPRDEIRDHIVRFDEKEHMVQATGGGPFLPWWQFAPVFPISALVNYDALSHPARTDTLQVLLQREEPLVSKVLDYSNIESFDTSGKKALLNMYMKHGKDLQGGQSYQEGPVSDLYFPIFDGGQSNTTKKPKMVAALGAFVYWQSYFENILPPDTETILAVLENTCGQMFTYEMHAEKAVYIGPGDFHDPKYNYLEQSTGFQAFLTSSNNTEEVRDGECIYNVRVYPTSQLEAVYLTEKPKYYTFIVLTTFLCTSLVFILYDAFVEKRQKIVMQKAIQSTEVVQSLFPENVRDRLFEECKSTNPKHKFDLQFGHGGEHKSLAPDRDNSEAIADLYEDCTVLFTDIAGFTKWSSQREPKQVFTLLETLYKSFDQIAKRRGVFKVETIGDCYLAITGVPRPQKDHAVIMVKFAVDCLESFNRLVDTKLVNTLGEDTRNLNMRYGLHSGSVTAGVLRGDRARFQLFGDTVNTAARMESTGVPGKIQISSTTAGLLIAAKKGAWLKRREGGVEAKGKGRLQTYFVNPRTQMDSTSGTSSEGEMVKVSRANAMVHPAEAMLLNRPRRRSTATSISDPYHDETEADFRAADHFGSRSATDDFGFIDIEELNMESEEFEAKLKAEKFLAMQDGFGVQELTQEPLKDKSEQSMTRVTSEQSMKSEKSTENGNASLFFRRNSNVSLEDLLEEKEKETKH